MYENENQSETNQSLKPVDVENSITGPTAPLLTQEWPVCCKCTKGEKHTIQTEPFCKSRYHRETSIRIDPLFITYHLASTER